MTVLRADRAVFAAGAVALAVASHSSSGRSAEIIQVPQPDVTVEDTVAPRPSETVPRLQLAQFPPPPFYIDHSPFFQRPWFGDDDRRYRARRERQPRDVQQDQPGGNEQQTVRERFNNSQTAADRSPREPNYFLTRHLRGNYKQRIATVLRHSPRLPAAKGPLLLTISIAKQTITAYDGGVQVATGPVSTGMPGHSTPTGVFSVLEKEWWHRSNLYSGAPMPFMQRLTWSGIALHAGELPGYRASHGCIRMPESFALRLWYMSNVGARVVIAWNEVSPAEIAHPSLFQPRPAPQPPAAPAPAVPNSTSGPSEDVPVSMNMAPDPQDEADAERDHMMLAAVDDGDTLASAASEEPRLQFAIDLEGLENGNGFDNQPVLELLSARRKAYARAPEAEYEAVGTPRQSSVSIFVSRRDSRIYVRKDAQPLFDVPVTIAEPAKPIGTHLFTAVSAESASKLRWTVVSPANEPRGEERPVRRSASLPAESPEPQPAAGALDRITIPQDAIDRIEQLVTVGTTLIVSDAGLGRTAAVPNADFSVVLH